MKITDGINLATLLNQDLLREKDHVQLRVVNSILYGNGKSIRGISHTSIQLVRTSFMGSRTKWFYERDSCLRGKAPWVVNGI